MISHKNVKLTYLIRDAILRVLFIVVTSWLVSACKQNSPILNTPANAITLTTSPTVTRTPTPNPTLTATALPSSTSTPSITPTPTEDLSFFNVANCIPKNSAFQRGTVTNIIDGDTIEVQLKDGNIYPVRYIGIDAPENGYPFYEEAMQANAELVLQRDVVLVEDQSEADQYQRLLRYVIVGTHFINQELVHEGYSKAVNYPPDEACKEVFQRAEETARMAMAGLWVPTQAPEPSAGQVVIVEVNKREEWVDIQNTGNSDVDLRGWNLVSERGNQDCPLSGILPASQILRIWASDAQGAGYSCGYNSPIWNNSEPDPAVLYNAQGVEVSRK